MFAAIVGQSWADDAHPFNLEINGVDRIASVPLESVRIEMAGPGTNGSCTFTILDPSAAISVTAWDEVRFIEHAATRPILFGGFVQSVRYVAWATAGRSVEVQCVGYGILLDKRIAATAFTPGATDYVTYDTYSHHPAMDIVAAVGQYGGRLTALCATKTFQGAPAAVESATDATYSVANLSEWALDILGTGYAAGQTLRAIISGALEAGYYEDTGGEYPGASGLFWADSAAMVRVLPVLPDIATANEEALQYDAGGTTLTVTAGTTTGITSLTFEVGGLDTATRVYVLGADAASSGWYTTSPPERTGDLETYVSDGRDWAEVLVRNVGQATVSTAGMDNARGEVALVKDATVEAWPGRHLTLTVAQFGLSSDAFRVTSVRIAFLGGNHREYVIGYGGRVPGEASYARSTGRYVRSPNRQSFV